MRSHVRLIAPASAVAVLLLLIAFPVLAQERRPAGPPSPIGFEGKEFWLAFQKNFRDYNKDDITLALSPAPELTLNLTITTSSPKGTKGYVKVAGIDYRVEFEVPPNGVVTVPIDSGAQIRSSERVERLGVRVVSDEPISVFAMNHRWQTTDTYHALPVDALGTTYRAIGYRWLADDLLSQFVVIGTQDRTRVTITPSVKTRDGKPAGIPFDVTLGEGESYQVIPAYNPATSTSDLTGTLIESDKPVALFAGHNCAYVPDNTTKACNLLVEQLAPVELWGQEFFLVPFAQRSSYVARVIAHKDGTVVSVDGDTVARLNAGEYYEHPNLTNASVIRASKPVQVAQYGKGFSAKNPESEVADSVGDPWMIVVMPRENYRTNYRFSTPIDGEWNHYINIIAPIDALKTVKIDGEPVDVNIFDGIGKRGYAVATVKIAFGSHTVSAAKPIGISSYGIGYASMIYDGYGNVIWGTTTETERKEMQDTGLSDNR